MKILLIMMLLAMPFNLIAGDGHDHGDSQFADNSGFVKSFDLSEAAIKNLDLKTVETKKDIFKESISLPCIIKNPPEQTSQIHTTYIGEVKKIYARIGDKVKKGQILYTLFSMKAVRDIPVIAPIDGIVSAQNVSIGQIVQLETVLMEITTNEYFIADGMAYLSDDISHVNIGDLAEVIIDGTHDNIIGIVQGFSPAVNPDTKSKSIFVDFKSNDSHVFPNMHCKMFVYYGEETRNIAIPKSALLGEFGNYFVFLQNGTHFEKVPVIIGRISGDLVEIKEGLHEHDNIVIQGGYQLQFVTPEAQEQHEEGTNV